MAKQLNSGQDCTEGSIQRHLLTLAVPILIGNSIHSGYIIIDMIWVGRFVGKEAIGAIAVSFPLLLFFTSIAAGATMATSILISQYFGAKKYEQVQRIIGSSFFFALMISITVSIAGYLWTDTILKLMGTPANIIPLAGPYLKMNFIGFSIMYAGYLIISILRGIGDSRTPLYFMIVGVIVNALLDPILIIGLGWFPRFGLVGAALASISGQIVATIVGYIYLRRRGNIVATGLNSIKWDRKIVKQICTIGLPTMLQFSISSLGIAVVTSIVNGFGDVATAAFGVAGRINMVTFFPIMSIGTAVSVISGQNIGTKKYNRVRHTFRWGFILSVTISVFFAVFYLIIPRTLLSVFVSDPEVVSIGAVYLRIIGPAGIFSAIDLVSNEVINGAGYTLMTLIFTLVSLGAVRVPAAIFLSKTALGIAGVWTGIVISLVSTMTLSLIWYFSGRWEKPVIKINLIE